MWTLSRLYQAAGEAGIADVAEGYSYRHPALLCRGKFLARLLDPGTMAVRCTLDEKAMLMEADPAVFFETPHYRGWPAVLVRLDAADDAMVRARLVAGAASLRGRRRG